jgi:C4-dicarboxylate-specific signal transduction histidine kinase
MQEKKMSQLLTNMITFTSGSTKGNAKVLSIDETFEHITSLVRGTFKNDNITFSVHLNDPTLILNNHVSDLQLVILAALQSSRTALNTKFKETPSAVKQITVTMDDEAIKQNEVVIQIHDNGAARSTISTSEHDPSTGPWHNMSFCKDFLQTFDGSLQINRNQDNTNDCVITIPFHKKNLT